MKIKGVSVTLLRSWAELTVISYPIRRNTYWLRRKKLYCTPKKIKNLEGSFKDAQLFLGQTKFVLDFLIRVWTTQRPQSNAATMHLLGESDAGPNLIRCKLLTKKKTKQNPRKGIQGTPRTTLERWCYYRRLVLPVFGFELTGYSWRQMNNGSK